MNDYKTNNADNPNRKVAIKILTYLDQKLNEPKEFEGEKYYTIEDKITELVSQKMIEIPEPEIESLNEPLNFFGDKIWIVKALAEEDIKDVIKNSIGNKPIKINENDMSKIANKLSDAIQECFWDSLDTIIRDYYEKNN